MTTLINRRNFVKTAGAAAAGMTAGGALARSAQAGAKPNVLLILVDQWRERRWFPDDGASPAVNRLRREGLSFTNHFTCAVPCSPARACLFTGLHLPQHGVQGNIDPIGGTPSLDPSIPTLGHVFRQAGYRTPYFGKWHLTNTRDYLAKGLTAYGFEDWRGPSRDGVALEGLLHDGRFARQAARWLEHEGDKGPWFLTCSLINPHDICWYKRFDVPPLMVPDVCDQLPDNFRDSLEGKPRIQKQYQDGFGKFMGMTPDQPEKAWREYIDFYYYLTRKVDEQIGNVLDSLDHLGLADNTIVIFTSDHGEMCGSHMLQSKGPFVYQENNNVPLVARWPGRIDAGAETKALTQSVDIFHTMLDLAGVPNTVDHLPGRSLAPLIADPGNEINQHALMSFNFNLNSTFAGFIIRGKDPSQRPPHQVRAIHDGRHKFARYFDLGLDDEYEMYDLVNDPLEMHNLAGDPGYRALEKEMAEKLKEAEAKKM